MRRCAFLTLANPGGYVIDDELAYEPFAALGWTVSSVPWSRPSIDWTSYDAVIVRSTWDYHHQPDHFCRVLEAIVSAGVPLFNSLELIRWNLSKAYLHDLARAGVAIVPTVTRPGLDSQSLPALFDELESSDLVVKPSVGANADGAFRLDRYAWRDQLGTVQSSSPSAGPVLVQPFVGSVQDEGEYSLFYFAGAYSHAILKTPAPGDFRSQEEHGAAIRALDAERSLRAAGEAAIAAAPTMPLYARVDLVRSPDPAVFWVMELELIEPSLYLRMDSGAPPRFAKAFQRASDRSAIRA
jgi:glutathione synthase/RimK-type ligase-like ATP-grasp enzyme